MLLLPRIPSCSSSGGVTKANPLTGQPAEHGDRDLLGRLPFGSELWVDLDEVPSPCKHIAGLLAAGVEIPVGCQRDQFLPVQTWSRRNSRL